MTKLANLLKQVATEIKAQESQLLALQKARDATLAALRLLDGNAVAVTTPNGTSAAAPKTHRKHHRRSKSRVRVAAYNRKYLCEQAATILAEVNTPVAFRKYIELLRTRLRGQSDSHAAHLLTLSENTIMQAAGKPTLQLIGYVTRRQNKGAYIVKEDDQ